MLTTAELQRIQVLFAKADRTQMPQIANMFNTTQRMNAASAAASFSKGQKVKWIGKRGKMAGTIVKVNSKNIRVQTETGDMWNVTATLLKAA